MKVETFHVSPGVRIDVNRARLLTKDRKPDSRVYLPRHGDICRRGWVGISKKYMCKKTSPALIMRIGRLYTVVDGNHRCLQAFKAGKIWYPAIVLSQEEIRLCAKDARWYKRIR